jgi:hypothetical protein
MKKISTQISKHKIVTAGIIVFILIILITGYIFFIHGTYVTTKVIGTTQINVEDNELIITGNTSESATGFSGYRYKIVDENLYLQIRYSIVSKVNPSGHFDINITDDNLKSVKKVFFQGGKTNDIELIWSR